MEKVINLSTFFFFFKVHQTFLSSYVLVKYSEICCKNIIALPFPINSTEACQNAHSNNSQCQSWADSGECQINPSWMSLNCQLSCSLCTQTCSDKHTSYECQYWAELGECTKNSDWMWSNCAFSCGCDACKCQ